MAWKIDKNVSKKWKSYATLSSFAHLPSFPKTIFIDLLFC